MNDASGGTFDDGANRTHAGDALGGSGAESRNAPVASSSGADPEAPLPFGDYRLERRLGGGGAGEVWEAVQKSLKRRVAVKLLRDAGPRSPDRVRRFLREAKAVAQLRHPNIVGVHGIGRTPEGGYFYVMDLVEGSSLERRVYAQDVTFRDAAALVATLADAVQHAHERGVVHRDLKPANVLLGATGEVMLTDFGLAKVLEGEDSGITQPGAILGTPGYMAPEQADARWGKVSPRSDVYSLGAILYALLVGGPPFLGDSVLQTVMKVASPEPPVPPRRICPEVPEALDAICMKCLSKDQAGRYGSAWEFAEALRTWRREAGPMEVKELLYAAFRRRRPGDILLLVRECVGDDCQALLRAAGYLRDLMAYPAVVEVCDRVLAIDPKNYRAMEQKALAEGRLEAELAMVPLLEEAAGIAQGRGEATAIIGRLHKQLWRASWYPVAGRPSRAAVEECRQQARHNAEHLFRAAKAYLAGFAQSGERDYFPGLNALTLLSLVRLLFPEGHPLAPEQLGQTCDGLERKLGTILAEAVDRATTGEERYWALVSQVELKIVSSSSQNSGSDIDGDVKKLVRLALRYAGLRLFLLDSTIQQLRMLLALGFRTKVVRPALEVLEHAWNVAIRPDLPRTRIVFAGHMIDAPGRPVPRFRPEDEEAAADELRNVVAQIAERRGDAVVYLSGACGGDILFAEACAEQGIPYVLHLPFEEEQFLDSSVRRGGENWVERFRMVQRKSVSPPGVESWNGRKTLVLSDHLGSWSADAPFAGVNRWMLASASVYDPANVVLVALWDGGRGDGPGGTADMIDVVTRHHGTVIHVPTPLARETIPLRPPEAEPSVQAAIPVPTSAVLTVSVSEGSEVGASASPLWLEDLGELLTSEGDADTKERWCNYRGRLLAWNVLGALELRFEPIEQLTPRLPVPVTLGFEVFSMHRDGRPYGALRKEAAAAGVEVGDLDLAVLALALQTVRTFRLYLQKRVGPETSRLFFSLKLSREMVRSRLLRIVLDRYFDPLIAARTPFEIGTGYFGSSDDLDPQERQRRIRGEIADLRALLQRLRLQIIFDDDGRCDADIRRAAWEIAQRTKADAGLTTRTLEHAAETGDDPAGAIVTELSSCRMPGKPFVIEGVETSDQYCLLQECWPDECEPVAMQGWAVCLRPPLATFFEPVNTEEACQPRGYRLGAEILRRLLVR